MIQKNTSQSRKDGSLSVYYEQIKGKSTRLLSTEEESALSKRIQRGDRKAVTELVEANLRLVVRIARTYRNSGISILDLIQEGNIGMLRAAECFDYKKNVRFSTYASWNIKQRMIRYIYSKSRTIRLPHGKEEIIRRAQHVYNYLMHSTMRAPTMGELAEAMMMSEEDLHEVLQLATSPISLDTTMPDYQTAMVEFIQDFTHSPDTSTMREALQDELLGSLKKLQDREQDVIRYRYGLDDGKSRTLKQVAALIAISPETVRQIEKRALGKLRYRVKGLFANTDAVLN